MKKKRTGDILGIDANYMTDFVMGLLVGGVILLVGKVFGVIGVIGVPINLAISLDELGKFLVIVGLAPIAEEIFFRNFTLSFFDDKLENFGIKVPFFVAAVLTSIVFALFHLSAYGGSLSGAGSSFFSAGLIGMIFAYEVKYFKSVLPSIMTHMVINLAILLSIMQIIG